MKSTSQALPDSLGIKFAALIFALAFTGSAPAQERIQPETELQLPAQEIELKEEDKTEENNEQDNKSEATTPGALKERDAAPPANLQESGKLPAIQKDKLPAVQKDNLPAVQQPQIPEPQSPSSELPQQTDNGLPKGARTAAGSTLQVNGSMGTISITRGSDGADATWSVPSTSPATHVRLEIKSSTFSGTCVPGSEGLPGTGMHPVDTSSVSIPVSNSAYSAIDIFYVRGCLYYEYLGSTTPLDETTNVVQVNIDDPDMAGDPGDGGDGDPGDGSGDSMGGFVPREPERDLGDRTPDALKDPQKILEEQRKEEVEIVHKPAQEVETVKSTYVLDPWQTRSEQVIKRKGDEFSGHCSRAHSGIASFGHETLWDLGDYLVVGYDHYNWWEPRKRCEMGFAKTYKSMVKFDVSELPDNREIQSATLSFVHVDENSIQDAVNKTAAQRIRHTNFCGGPTGDHRTMVGEAIAVIGFPRADWAPGRETVSNHTPTNIIYGLTPKSFQKVDITPWVKTWVNNPDSNRGLAFLGKRYWYPQTNKVCIAHVGDIQLEVEY